MRTRGRRAQHIQVLWLLLLPFFTVGSFPAKAQGNSRTFVETGKVVQGRFLEYWDSHGGLAQQGYPISDELQESSQVDGRTYLVQYFERAVFEHHPENQPPFDVLLSLLGDFAYNGKYPSGAPGQQPDNSDNSVFFEQTGKRVGGKFLAYWQQHGGLSQQGYPISDEFVEVSELDGKPYLVQYFERAEFEYHPENNPPYDVLLAQLGTFAFRSRNQPAPTASPTAVPQLTPPSRPTAPVGGGGDWPMYGQNAGRTDYNAAENLISAQNLRQVVARWQAPLGTNGNPSSSSPVVANDRVYVGSSAPGGPNFYAFNAATGTPSWSADVGYFESCDGVGIGSTAAISGTVLVVGGGDRAYYGLNAITGERLWRMELGVGPSGFAWESPLLAGGRAYIGVASDCDNPSVRGEIRAVDMLTGAQVANRYFVPEGKAGAGIWNSPALSPDGAKVLAVTGEDFADYDGPYNRAMVSLDPGTLDILQANKQGPTDTDSDFATSPIAFQHNGRAIVFAGHKNSSFYAYDADHLDNGPIWSRPVGLQVGVLPAFAPDNGGEILFIAHDVLFAVDPDTGADRWGPLLVGEAHGNIAVANGLVYINVGAVGVIVVDAETGHLLTTLTPASPGPSFSGVALAHGFIYWVSGSQLNAWRLPAP